MKGRIKTDFLRKKYNTRRLPTEPATVKFVRSIANRKVQDIKSKLSCTRPDNSKAVPEGSIRRIKAGYGLLLNISYLIHVQLAPCVRWREASTILMSHPLLTTFAFLSPDEYGRHSQRVTHRKPIRLRNVWDFTSPLISVSVILPPDPQVRHLRFVFFSLRVVTNKFMNEFVLSYARRKNQAVIIDIVDEALWIALSWDITVDDRPYDERRYIKA